MVILQLIFFLHFDTELTIIKLLTSYIKFMVTYFKLHTRARALPLTSRNPCVKLDTYCLDGVVYAHLAPVTKLFLSPAFFFHFNLLFFFFHVTLFLCAVFFVLFSFSDCLLPSPTYMLKTKFTASWFLRLSVYLLPCSARIPSHFCVLTCVCFFVSVLCSELW